jgi:hypothetical protein
MHGGQVNEIQTHGGWDNEIRHLIDEIMTHGGIGGQDWWMR